MTTAGGASERFRLLTAEQQDERFWRVSGLLAGLGVAEAMTKEDIETQLDKAARYGPARLRLPDRGSNKTVKVSILEGERGRDRGGRERRR